MATTLKKYFQPKCSFSEIRTTYTTMNQHFWWSLVFLWSYTGVTWFYGFNFLNVNRSSKNTDLSNDGLSKTYSLVAFLDNSVNHQLLTSTNYRWIEYGTISCECRVVYEMNNLFTIIQALRSQQDKFVLSVVFTYLRNKVPYFWFAKDQYRSSYHLSILAEKG